MRARRQGLAGTEEPGRILSEVPGFPGFRGSRVASCDKRVHGMTRIAIVHPDLGLGELNFLSPKHNYEAQPAPRCLDAACRPLSPALACRRGRAAHRRRRSRAEGAGARCHSRHRLPRPAPLLRRDARWCEDRRNFTLAAPACPCVTSNPPPSHDTFCAPCPLLRSSARLSPPDTARPARLSAHSPTPDAR